MIDGPFNEDCIFQFETKEDRILAFSVVDGDLIETENFLAVNKQNWFYYVVTFILANGYIIIYFRKIHDGIDSKAPVLLVENRKLLELSNQDLPTTVYTSQSEAVIQFTKKPTSNLKLKIQKVTQNFHFFSKLFWFDQWLFGIGLMKNQAVRCAFNLGLDSQCGRVVDEVSCYCATFINVRNWQIAYQ